MYRYVPPNATTTGPRRKDPQSSVPSTSNAPSQPSRHNSQFDRRLYIQQPTPGHTPGRTHVSRQLVTFPSLPDPSARPAPRPGPDYFEPTTNETLASTARPDVRRGPDYFEPHREGASSQVSRRHGESMKAELLRRREPSPLLNVKLEPTEPEEREEPSRQFNRKRKRNDNCNDHNQDNDNAEIAYTGRDRCWQCQVAKRECTLKQSRRFVKCTPCTNERCSFSPTKAEIEAGKSLRSLTSVWTRWTRDARRRAAANGGPDDNATVTIEIAAFDELLRLCHPLITMTGGNANDYLASFNKGD